MPLNYTIKNGVITDGHSMFLDNGFIRVEDGKIASIGKAEEMKDTEGEFIDAGGRLIIPGLLNPHHHLYSRFAVGIVPLGPTDKLSNILKNLWWPLDRVLDEETIYYSALSGVLDSVKYGVTTIFDHHASNNYVRGSLDLIKKAFEEIGIKGSLSFEISDREGEDVFQKQLEENLIFYQESVDSILTTGMMGLHANFTLSNDSLKAIKEAKPERMPIHIHCGEGREDYDFCVDQGFRGPVHRLDQFGLLNSSSLLIHCVHLSDEDYRIINEKQPVVVSNPESNANNNVGMINTEKIKDYIVGTDGMSGNIIGSYRSHFLRRNGAVENPADKLFRRSEEIIKSAFPECGGLQKGHPADLAVLDYIPETPISLDNLFFHLILGFGAQKTYMTISEGNIVYKDGKIQTVDEEALKKEIKKAARKLQGRFYE
ncbi:MAG: amidohydrolase family protein [Bacteroidales bacterium]|nr:amidohydrolase family protein [Bacteroidales bacterium]